MNTYSNLERTKITNLLDKQYFSFSNLEEFYNSIYNIQNGDLIKIWNLKSVYKFKSN